MNFSKKILIFHIFSLIFVLIIGTLLHFTYDWSNQNPIIAVFSSTNESVWEHLKLIFFPMLITSIIGYFYIGKDYENYLCSRAFSIFSAICFIVIFYFTYTGIIGKNYAFLDIGSFLIADILGEFISFKNLFTMQNIPIFANLFTDSCPLKTKKCNKFLALSSIFILLIAFIIFTFYQPSLNIFKDPNIQTDNKI